jgi:Flp pilus assembly protein TadG
MNRLRRPHAENGQTMVEFALVAPLLLVLVIAIVQLGIAYNHYLRLTDAVRAGARKASVSRLLVESPKGKSASDAVYDAADLDPSKLVVTVTASPDWTKPGNEVTVQAKYDYSINIMGIVVKSGQMTATTTERLE